MGLTTHVVRGRNAERLLFLMHGLGANEQDLASLVPHLDPDGRFLGVFPRGPYSAPPGWAWFRFGGPPELVTGTLASSLDAADEALDAACEQHRMSREDAVVGGFSQGSSVALALAFRRGRPRPAGVLALSGFLPPDVDYEWNDPPAVLVQHGSYDPLIPASGGKATAETLAQNGVPVVYREYPMQHEVTLDSVRDAREWLDLIRAGERPSEPIEEAAAPDDPVRSVSSAEFEREVLQSPKPVIVDFWAPWCQPCRMVAPVVEQIAKMREGSYKVVKVNIDDAQDLAQRYQIQSIPLVALFRNGRLERRSLGAKPRQQMEAELGMLVIP